MATIKASDPRRVASRCPRPSFYSSSSTADLIRALRRASIPINTSTNLLHDLIRCEARRRRATTTDRRRHGRQLSVSTKALGPPRRP
jgi:hypothetical protein